MPTRAKQYRPPHHAVERREANRRTDQGDRGYGARWRKLRAAWLAAEPRTCETCGATNKLHVHHRIEHRGDPALLFDWDNLATLCGRCHNRHHMLARHATGEFRRETCSNEQKSV